MKRVLMIAFHFPPLAGSSGIQRTLRFCRYLPDFGWKPIILTAHPRAYENRNDDQLGDIPPGVEVIRAPAWDASRHFSVAGRYPGVLARPDRWLSWWLGALPAGMATIRRLEPDALWSTYPIATAHMIGASLARLSGLPWIADFRDPMAQEDYPPDPAVWRSFDRIERRALSRACFSTFTTPSAAQTYRARYPAHAGKIELLENGYDEETFSGIPPGGPLNPGMVTLLHSGVVYPAERDPSQLFSALSRLKSRSRASFDRLCVRFRAPVHEALLHELGQRYDVAEAIEVLPAIAYRDALGEMLRAEGLLVLQAANCNEQVPAKLYEYFRAQRPTLLLTDPEGDTARTARDAGIEAIAPLDDAQAIATLLEAFLAQPERGTLATPEAIARSSRVGRTRVLAGLLDRAIVPGTRS